MTTVYQGREFHGFVDRGAGRIFADFEFRDCHFVGCSVSTTREPRRRSVVRNVKLLQCAEHGCALDTAVVEDTLIDGFVTHGLFQSWGAVFMHVTIKGKVGRLMTSPLIATGTGTAQQQRAFDEANASYYATVDWALDIREACFEEADLRGIPANLVIRDPDTQFVLRREKALEGKWKDIELRGTHWKGAIELFLDTGSSSKVLVAPRGNARFNQLLEGLRTLHDAGVVE